MTADALIWKYNLRLFLHVHHLLWLAPTKLGPLFPLVLGISTNALRPQVCGSITERNGTSDALFLTITYHYFQQDII